MADSAKVIMFVDDEENIIKAITRELRAWASSGGYELHGETSAAAGLAFLREHAARTQLVVSDLRMPEMKGSDFLLAVKESWPEIPTILLSGYSEAEELMKAVKAGITSYILKPWDPEYLRAEIEKAIEGRRMREQNAQYAKMIQEELKWAGELQRVMLKPALKATDGIEFKTSWKPLEGMYCGGDFYDVVNLGKLRYLVLLGDVAGHGVRAALVSAILKSVIEPEYLAQADARKFSTRDFMTWLNKRITFELRQAQGLIVTFFAAIIDLEAHVMRYTNAGQCTPYLLTGKTAMPLTGIDPALGFFADIAYSERTVPFVAGDILFAHTDGLTELGSKEGSDDAAVLKTVLESIPYGDDWHHRILNRCLAMSGKTAFEDDIAIISARFP